LEKTLLRIFWEDFYSKKKCLSAKLLLYEKILIYSSVWQYSIPGHDKGYHSVCP